MLHINEYVRVTELVGPTVRIAVAVTGVLCCVLVGASDAIFFLLLWESSLCLILGSSVYSSFSVVFCVLFSRDALSFTLVVIMCHCVSVFVSFFSSDDSVYYFISIGIFNDMIGTLRAKPKPIKNLHKTLFRLRGQ